MEVRKIKAFSLVELLISLIIISLIVAAFAPIMTKKLVGTGGFGGAIGSGSTSGNIGELLLMMGDSYKDGLYNCTKTGDEKYTICKFQVPDNVFEMSAVLVGGGGGGAGGVNSAVQKDIELTTSSSELEKSITIEKGMTNVRVTALVGAGGGGGAGYNTSKTNITIEECPAKTEKVYSNNGAIYCITKYNLRPEDYSQYHNNYQYVYHSPSGTVLKEHESKASSMEIGVPINLAKDNEVVTSGGYWYNYTTYLPACWITAYRAWNGNSYAYCSNDTAYPGCGRTVCNWWAASAMCPLLDLGGSTCNDGNGNFIASCKGKWRLPTAIEMFGGADETKEAIFYNNYYGYKNSSKNSLSLCTYINNVSINPEFKCDDVSACYSIGSSNTVCSPQNIWAEENTCCKSASYYQYGQYAKINSQVFIGPESMGQGTQKNYAFSVRCVLRASDPPKDNSYSGGGGGSGASITSSILIDNEIIRNNIGAQIVLKAGKGGSGGIFDESTDPKTPNDGQEGEYSEVRVVSGSNTIWGYRVYGGPGGQKSTTSAPGGASSIVSKCQQYNNGGWQAVTCPKNGAAGGVGSKFLNSGAIAAGGEGGLVPGTNFGKGGDGGKGGRNATTNKGEDGNPGLASVKYNLILSKGAAGGGGSGACASRIENISVKRGDSFDIKIGGGGEGGNIELDGLNGGETMISLGSRFKYTMLGGRGGKTGIPGRKTGDTVVEPVNGAESDETTCEVLDDIISETQKDYIVFKYPGKIGTAASIDAVTKNAMGGVGGLSGFSGVPVFPYTYGGCGGYFNEICLNNDRNGLSSGVYLPSKLQSSENYGTLGAGGGGGGWQYDLAEPEPAGVGGKGLDGFVSFYWRKPGK